MGSAREQTRLPEEDELDAALCGPGADEALFHRAALMRTGHAQCEWRSGFVIVVSVTWNTTLSPGAARLSVCTQHSRGGDDDPPGAATAISGEMKFDAGAARGMTVVRYMVE
jgi:hypothetical protein